MAETDKYMHFVCLSHNHSPRRNWAFHKDSSAALKRVDEFGKVTSNHDNKKSFAWQQSSLVASFHRKSVCAVCRHCFETASLLFTFQCLFASLF